MQGKKNPIKGNNRAWQSADKWHMCEYIIPEDLRMDKYKCDESGGLWYEMKGDHYFLCLPLPEADRALGAAAQELLAGAMEEHLHAAADQQQISCQN